MTDPVDAIADFALPARRLFPCDTPALTRASIEAFDDQASRLPASEKIAAARHIAKRASDHGLDVHDHDVGRLAGDELSPWFSVALGTRRAEVAHEPEALGELKTLAFVAGQVASCEDRELRGPLLDKLAEAVAAFDGKWDKMSYWQEIGIPDAADTVFAVDTAERGVVDVGSRPIRATDFAALDKVAASKALSPEAMASAENWQTFQTAPWDHQTALAAFIPGRGR